MSEVRQLVQDIKISRANWDEKSPFSLKGIGNLSMSDLDALEMYAVTYINSAGSFQGLMEPVGEIKEVLDAYGVKSYSLF